MTHTTITPERGGYRATFTRYSSDGRRLAYRSAWFADHAEAERWIARQLGNSSD